MSDAEGGLPQVVRPEIVAAIPTRNRARLLERAIQSLLKQTLAPERYEVLVIDNASTDGTRSLVEAYQGGAVRVRYVREPVLGVSHARNRAIAEAKAPIITFMDDDAWAEEGWLEAILEGFQREQQRPLAIGGKIVLDWETPRPGWLPNPALIPLGAVDYGEAARELVPSEMLFGTNMAFERLFLVGRDGFDTRLGRVGNNLVSNEETALLRDVRAEGGSIVYLPGAVVHHLVHRERVRVGWFVRRLYAQGVSDVIEASIRGEERLSASAATRKLAANAWRRWRRLAKRRDSQSAFSLVVTTAYAVGVLNQTLRPGRDSRR